MGIRISLLHLNRITVGEGFNPFSDGDTLLYDWIFEHDKHVRFLSKS